MRLKKIHIVNPEKVKEQFYGKTFINSDGCWIWKGLLDRIGYGWFTLGKEDFKAHRVSYTVFKGEIPDGMLVLHTCDNPSCCNPEHLWLGTQKDNMKDCAKKERLRGMNRNSCKEKR